MNKKRTFYIQTLGCKVNQYESDGIAAGLEACGLTCSRKAKGVDVCIVNTCAVTSKAGMQSRQAIRKLIRENPGAQIIVTGCHAQTDPEQIQKIEDIDHIVCHRDKTRIASLLSGDADVSLDFKPPVFGKEGRFLGFDRPVSGSMTRAYLKIQDGCNAFCTYCIVPYARGRSVSMPVAEVHQHIRSLAEKGFKEIILTGIHTGLYGQDLNPATSLLELVRSINDKRPVERIRISSIEPNEIEPGLIDLARDGQILCDHFHIPLQSGDNRILERMKRPYTAEAFTKVIDRIHTALPFAGIGLDIIVGFPGETDQAFETTYNLLKDLPVSYFHVFPFSPRKGTPAWHFTPKVHSKIIKDRCAALRELGEKKRAAFIRANLGRRLTGLVQHQTDRNTGMLKAVTGNYLTVLVDPKGPIRGKTVDLVLEQCDNGTIIGKVQ